MHFGVTGFRSTIASAFAAIVQPQGHKIEQSTLPAMRLDLDGYLICTGFLAGKALHEISDEASELTWRRNYVEVVTFADRVLKVNERARICLLGSESGFAGSYDMAYAGAKAALHRYVETKRLYEARQMLVALAPHIVWDTRMTQRRADLDTLAVSGAVQRLGRWLTAEEVAREAAHLLIDASPALSGQVIRMRP
jgi:NAD(P)-dependent dehydrogenase (short-subunit alcohol dehydrogenase family)